MDLLINIAISYILLSPSPPGNINLVYSLIRSKVVFYQLANLPEDSYQISRPQGGGREGGELPTLPQVPLEGEQQPTTEVNCQ